MVLIMFVLFDGYVVVLNVCVGLKWMFIVLLNIGMRLLFVIWCGMLGVLM